MYGSRTTKNTCTEIDLICTEVVMYRKCPPLCTETVMYRKRRNPKGKGTAGLLPTSRPMSIVAKRSPISAAGAKLLLMLLK